MPNEDKEATTASGETVERARRIGRQITEALKGHGVKANSTVRTWSAATSKSCAACLERAHCSA